MSLSPRQIEIIEAAGSILTQYGVSGLTTKNLAQAMGFSESALYRHFKNKEEVIISMLVFLKNNMHERSIEVLSKDHSSTVNFRNIFQSHLDFFKAHPHFVVAVFSDGLFEESDEINRSRLQLMEMKTSLLLPILREGQLQNEFTDRISTEEMLKIVMGTIRLTMFKWRLSQFQSDIQTELNTTLQSLLTLISK